MSFSFVAIRKEAHKYEYYEILTTKNKTKTKNKNKKLRYEGYHS